VVTIVFTTGPTTQIGEIVIKNILVIMVYEAALRNGSIVLHPNCSSPNEPTRYEPYLYSTSIETCLI
ncbi:hypothetical protein LCGC14_3000190, partial [marine sediment metagenome]